MKNQLQYVYSISVFMGVLLTAYLMLNNEGNARIPLRALQEPGLRTEAAVDPAIQQLFQMEQDLGRIKPKRILKRSELSGISDPASEPSAE